MNKDLLIKEKQELEDKIDILEHEVYTKGIEIRKAENELSVLWGKVFELNEKIYD